MRSFRQHLNEKLKDPEFRKMYEEEKIALRKEMAAITKKQSKKAVVKCRQQRSTEK